MKISLFLSWKKKKRKITNGDSNGENSIPRKWSYMYLQTLHKDWLKNIVNTSSTRELRCWHFFILPVNHWWKCCFQRETHGSILLKQKVTRFVDDTAQLAWLHMERKEKRVKMWNHTYLHNILIKCSEEEHLDQPNSSKKLTNNNY